VSIGLLSVKGYGTKDGEDGNEKRSVREGMGPLELEDMCTV